MKNKFYYILFLVVFSSSALITSCVKEETDEPPTANIDPPGVSANAFIGALNVLSSTTIQLITSDVIIAGIVVADDKSGNFYKQMILQDSTGGISILLDVSNFNTDYPVGRRVFVKCKGLFFQKDIDGNVQLGVNENNAVGRIPQVLVSQYLLKGKWGLTVTPIKATIANLANNTALTNMLVQIDSAEFVDTDTSKTYANASTKQSANLTVEQCTGTVTLSLYSSGFANFAGNKAAKGKGSITGIFTLYSSNPELQVRDIYDVKMNGNRCGSGDTVGTGALMSIADIRALYTGSDAIFSNGTKLRGTVISDLTNGNITANNIVVQDATGGIVIRFTTTNTFMLNDSVEVNLSGNLLTTFGGLLQVNNATLVNVTTLGIGTPSIRTATISQLNPNLSAWESTLVKILNSTISGSGTYSGSPTLTDATGSVTLYTRTGASFAGTNTPTGTVSVTAIVSSFSSAAELNIRNTTDVQ